MGNEQLTSPEEVARKEAWLKSLADFIVIANGKTWAADGAEVKPRRPGYKRLQWPYPDDKMTDRDREDYRGWEDWRLEDEFTGYFRAPGMTTVYYKEVPAWTMSYGGHGQTEGYEDRASETFTFLRMALLQVTSALPIRGPKEFTQGNKKYVFKMLKGNIESGTWEEEIIEDNVSTFSQDGAVGLVIHKDQNKQPVFPWNR